jgi:choline kinase
MTEVAAIGAEDYVRTIYNPRYRGGPILSLWTAREVLRSGDDCLFMDADVLYQPVLLERLLRSPHRDCTPLDRHIELGDDPVRMCIRDGHLVDFGKKIEGDFDIVGEWPGFMRMSPRIAARIADATDDFIDRGVVGVTYEEAMRAVLVSEPPGTFGYEDVSGIPWIEIDYPSDLLRAEKIILPRLQEGRDSGAETGEQDRPKEGQASGG